VKILTKKSFYLRRADNDKDKTMMDNGNDE